MSKVRSFMVRKNGTAMSTDVIMFDDLVASVVFEGEYADVFERHVRNAKFTLILADVMRIAATGQEVADLNLFTGAEPFKDTEEVSVLLFEAVRQVNKQVAA